MKSIKCAQLRESYRELTQSFNNLFQGSVKRLKKSEIKDHHETEKERQEQRSQVGLHVVKESDDWVRTKE